ncbi:MAG: chalcone isomerase family protein, partial [Deltaproteobacteria bacterium]|nr:chalcone isomerase family protein [Deltaproteobacteria bacterium]
FNSNGSADQLAKLSSQINAFNDMFETVKSGDRIILDYTPAGGTSVFIGEELKGVIEGKAFNDLLLSIWLGKSPVDEDLRDDLLGK